MGRTSLMHTLAETVVGLAIGWALAPHWLGLPIRCRMVGRLRVHRGV